MPLKLWVLVVVTIALPFIGKVHANEEVLFELSGGLPSVEPEIERRQVVMPDIDNEIIEIGAHVGSVNVEDFGSSLTYGGKLAFHVTSAFFLEARASYASVTDEPFRRYNLTLFGSDGRTDMQSYSVTLGWNILPGEVYLSKGRSFNASAYLLGGAGSISFAGDDYFSVLIGMGLRVLPTDWLSIRAESIVYEYESNIFGYDKFSHNAETHIGIHVFF